MNIWDLRLSNHTNCLDSYLECKATTVLKQLQIFKTLSYKNVVKDKVPELIEKEIPGIFKAMQPICSYWRI